MNIFKAMVPDKVIKSLDELSYDDLAARGIDCLLLDFDNTLGPDHATEPTEYSYKIVNTARDKGFKMCLVSNAKSGRSDKIAKMLDIPCVTYAHKPRADGVNRALALMGTDRSRAVMIGDQVFTDVMAGRFAGVYTIMCEKYARKEMWYIVLKRPFEKLVRLIAGF
ncbi:MAG: YqeG family HAD IIIA-type phosphatase [Clostridiales bacterium]|nr:YqeG family HAD IIIA-type phosphatase [Clostridiales bacterium]